jgi:hypothetical protein
VKGDKVYMPLDYEIACNADLNNRELLIIIITINYNKKKVLAIIILQGIYHLRGHFQKERDGGILLARSLISFINMRLGIKYLSHFHKDCPPSHPRAYEVLIFNNYNSHLLNEFLNILLKALNSAIPTAYAITHLF